MASIFTDIPEGAIAAQYIAKRWGSRVRLLPRASIAIGTTATRIVANNPRRMQVMMVNVGSSPVYIGFDAAVSTSADIPLSGGGGSLTLLIDEDGELTTYDVYGIAAAGGNNVLVWEVNAL